MAPIRLNSVGQQAAPSDRIETLATKTRIGLTTLIGGALALGGAAVAARYGYAVPGAANMATFLTTNLASFAGYVPKFITDAVKSLPASVTGEAAVGFSAALIAGSVIGGAAGRLTAQEVSLNDVKAGLGVSGSDLNFSQIQRVANVAVDGGVVVQFKDDASRIRNLNNELTRTEWSLSSNAHNTSKARGAEDRFFDLEGGRLAGLAQTTGDFSASLEQLKATVNAEVKATDKYTYQQGNSSTSIDRREYILAGIMGHAYQRGIAGNYLSAAVEERAERAKTEPKQAEADFRQALSEGVATGILAPKEDPRGYEGLVKSGARALEIAPKGKNRDAVIRPVFDAMKEAGLIDNSLRSRFIKDVYAKAANPEAEIVDPIVGPSEQAGTKPGSVLIDKLLGKFTNIERKARSGLDNSFDNPAGETNSQRKARLAAEAEAQATAHVNLYSDTLASLDPRQKDLANLYERLTQLLTEKGVPLNQIMEMDPRKLRGVLAMRHTQGFDLFDKYEANDAAIAETLEEIGVVTDEINAARTPRPEDFRFASKEQRKAAAALEKQVREEDDRIEGLKAKAEKAAAKIDKIESTLGDDEVSANHFLFDKGTSFDAPAVPQEPSFFSKIFGGKKVEDTTELSGDEVSFDAPVVSLEEDIVVDESLPDPIVEETK
jgi:hypothetical protein